MLICEGRADRAFFKALLEVRGISGVRVETTAQTNYDTGGITKIGSKLRSLKISSTQPKYSRYLIVVDADDDRDAAFKLVCDQIECVVPGVRPVREAESIGVGTQYMVVLIPGGSLGCLETLCCLAARDYNSQITSAVDTFYAQLRCDQWSRQNSRSKLWLRAILAASWEKDPSIYLKSVFTDKGPRKLIDLQHEAFNHLSDIIRRFSSDDA